jgi:hypothetical protein
MRKQYTIVSAVMVAAFLLVSCGGGGDRGNDVHDVVPVPGISSAVTYSFDLGAVDPATGIYYLTDRTNKSIDVLNTQSPTTVTQFKQAFAGCNTTGGAQSVPTCGSGTNNDASGPDGLDVVGPNLYVGDVNALWILNKTNGALVKKISIPSTPNFLRADEGCFDPDHNIYAISTPGADHPFMTFVDTVTQNVIATVVMNDTSGNSAAGLEACVYDSPTGKFFVNNDGSTANPRGEVDGIPATAIAALKPGPTTVNLSSLAGVSKYPLGNCDPTGIATGPGNDLGVMCRQGNVGETLTFMILDKTNGNVLANLNIGGGDQITYDATSKRWYLGDSRWTATGTSCGSGSAACPLTPVLGVVDGSTRTIVAKLLNGNNAHSVAVSGPNHLVVMPFTAPSATGGGANFLEGGLLLFDTF